MIEARLAELHACRHLGDDGADAAAVLCGAAFCGPVAAACPLAATELAARPSAGQSHAIVVGYGRVGKVVCALLKEHGIPYIAADSNASTVTRDRRDGLDVYYGDADAIQISSKSAACAPRPASSSPSTTTI